MIIKEDRNDNDILIVYHSVCIDFVYFSHNWVSLRSSSFALANSTRFNTIATVLLTLLIEFFEFYLFYSLLLESNL